MEVAEVFPWMETEISCATIRASGLLGTARPKNNRRGPQSVVEQRVSILDC